MNALLPVDATTATFQPTAPVAPVAATSSPVSAAPLSEPQWQQLVTPGHVLGHRLQRWGRVRFPIAICIGLAAIFVGFQSLQAESITVLQVPGVGATLLGNPNTHTDLGGGVRTSYRAAWLTDFPIERGLSFEAWSNLVEAVKADIRTYGPNAGSWPEENATLALPVLPKITRPERALTDWKDHLATGIVTIPYENRSMQIIGFVEGAWALINLDYAGCTIAFGPDQEGCNRAIDYSQYADVLEALKPAPATTTTTEEIQP